jgi:O-antigen/teichoic acid export membrane protein
MIVNTQRLAKNTGIMMVSQVISWSITVLLVFIVPRYLGPDNYGTINLGWSLFGIISVFAVFGMDMLLTKTIARTPEKLNQLLGQSILMRMVLFLIGIVGLILYISVVGYEKDTILLIFLTGIPVFIGVLSSGISASIQALERIEFIAIANIVAKSIGALLIIIAIYLEAGVVPVILVTGSGAVISLVLLSVILIRIYPVKLSFQIQSGQIKWLLTAGSAFFLLYIFITIYHNIDVVVISRLIDEKAIGVYSVADRLVGTMMFIPTAFLVVFFPTFSRLYLEGPETLQKIFVKATNLVILLGIAVGFGTFTISDQVISLLYGPDYIQSTPILSIRAITLVFTYLNIIMGMYLMSIDRQKVWVFVIALASLATIPLDLLFVPLAQNMFGNGAMGGAIASVITEFGMVVAAVILIPAGIFGKQTIWYALKCIFAGAGMIVCVYAFGMKFLPLQIIIGMISFTIFAFLLRLITPEDIQMVRRGIQRYLSKFRKKAAQPAN